MCWMESRGMMKTYTLPTAEDDEHKIAVGKRMKAWRDSSANTMKIKMRIRQERIRFVAWNADRRVRCSWVWNQCCAHNISIHQWKWKTTLGNKVYFSQTNNIYRTKSLNIESTYAMSRARSENAPNGRYGTLFETVVGKSMEKTRLANTYVFKKCRKWKPWACEHW